MALFLPRRWRRQPTAPVDINWSHPISRGLEIALNPATSGIINLGSNTGSITKNGTIGTAYGSGVHGASSLITNSGEKKSAAEVFNYIDLPTSAVTSAVTALYVGTRFSTPAANYVPVAVCTRTSAESAGFEIDLGNGYGDANLVYFGSFGATTGDVVYCNGQQAIGTNPTNVTVTNGQVIAVLGSFTTHVLGSGYTLLAKASGAGANDFANDVGCSSYFQWSRQLSDLESREVTANPWQLFAPQRNVLYFLGTAGTGAYTIPAAQGSYTFTGNAATLTKQSKLTADQQSYTLTGNATNLLKTSILTATQQTYTLSGIDAGLFHGQALITSTGSFTLTGNDVIFNRGVILPTSSGSFTLTGNAASLLKTYVLALSSGTFTLTGNDATLTHSLATNKTLIADTGTFTLTGNDVTFPYNQVLAAGTGSFTETGNDANLLVGKKLSTTTGNFIFTGNDTGLAQSYIFSIDKGTFVLTGRNVNLWYPTAPAGTPLEILKLSTAQYMGVSEPNISVVDVGGGTYTVTVNSGESMSKVDSVHYEGYRVNSGTELGS